MIPEIFIYILHIDMYKQYRYSKVHIAGYYFIIITTLVMVVGCISWLERVTETRGLQAKVCPEFGQAAFGPGWAKMLPVICALFPFQFVEYLGGLLATGPNIAKGHSDFDPKTRAPQSGKVAIENTRGGGCVCVCPLGAREPTNSYISAQFWFRLGCILAIIYCSMLVFKKYSGYNCCRLGVGSVLLCKRPVMPPLSATVAPEGALGHFQSPGFLSSRPNKGKIGFDMVWLSWNSYPLVI